MSLFVIQAMTAQRESNKGAGVGFAALGAVLLVSLTVAIIVSAPLFVFGAVAAAFCIKPAIAIGKAALEVVGEMMPELISEAVQDFKTKVLKIPAKEPQKNDNSQVISGAISSPKQAISDMAAAIISGDNDKLLILIREGKNIEENLNRDNCLSGVKLLEKGRDFSNLVDKNKGCGGFGDNPRGYTPLMLACEAGNDDAAKLLIAAGANTKTYICMDGYWTDRPDQINASYIANYMGRTEVVKLIAEAEKGSRPDINSPSPMIGAEGLAEAYLGGRRER